MLHRQKSIDWMSDCMACLLNWLSGMCMDWLIRAW